REVRRTDRGGARESSAQEPPADVPAGRPLSEPDEKRRATVAGLRQTWPPRRVRKSHYRAGAPLEATGGSPRTAPPAAAAIRAAPDPPPASVRRGHARRRSAHHPCMR